jgi:hypothetical protein
MFGFLVWDVCLGVLGPAPLCPFIGQVQDIIETIMKLYYGFAHTANVLIPFYSTASHITPNSRNE